MAGTNQLAVFYFTDFATQMSAAGGKQVEVIGGFI
jgi:hypothetical protein